MSNVFDKNYPSPELMQDILQKLNAFGHEPRVVVEFDKMTYVPGLKSRFEVWDRVRTASIEYTASNTVVNSPLTDEPSTITNGGESGDRFEYIKCAFSGQVKQFKLPDAAYYFLLAVAKHETAFGTLGQGKPENGSFIVGYGCPSSCDYTYSGADTQAHYAAKRFADAMKSRVSDIKSRGYMTQSDVNYFHDGGDKGKAYTWSADGANWKSKVYSYYNSIRNGSKSKWTCKSSSSVGNPNMVPMADMVDFEDCGCGADNEEVYTIADQTTDMHNIAVNVGDSGGGLTASVFPVEGISFATEATVSSHYYSHKGGRPGHKGIDIVDKTSGKVNGMWVVAAWAGIVDKAYKSTTYGNVVFIQHGNGFMTVYAHMQNDSIQVRVGQEVNAGTRLGKVGMTGDANGPHLHFEIWKGKWVYHGSNTIDPYWALLGAQKVGAVPKGSPSSGSGDSGSGGSGDSSTPKIPDMKVTTNLKFNKCFDKSSSLDSNWIDKGNIKWFTSTKTGEKYIGFSGNVKTGEVKSFGYKHNFSADGYFEYSFFADLQGDDSVVVSYDGMVVRRYTSKDNTSHPTYESPIYGTFTTDSTSGANSHILDFTIENNSGHAVFGIKCFKVAEVEVKYGAATINESIVARKRDQWLETGAFVHDTTYTLEDDILSWEVNTHYDMGVSTATLTLDNKYGIYSPTYERSTVFPDNMREAEMSYYEEGSIRHVLSEQTPVRIYVGYGENLVRQFTGRIKGEVQVDSENNTVTISCVDMYDELNEYVFDTIMAYPNTNEIHFSDGSAPPTLWVKSAIVHNIVNEAGMVGWRYHDDDLKYPDVVLEETYYIDIDRGGKKAVVWDSKKKEYVTKTIKTVKDASGYKNPYVQAITFAEGTRASDAIQQLIGDIQYRSYCDRYGTYHLENTRNLTKSNDKWEFIDGENLISLTTSIDHSRARNHLMIAGSGGQIEHFVDKELFIATKGKPRTANVVADWIDESYGSNARGIKEEIANRLFYDMKSQARTFNVVVKGNPMLEILDGVYIYDQNTSSVGYFIIKGNRVAGTKDGFLNYLELTWEDSTTHKVPKQKYNIPPETDSSDVTGSLPPESYVKCGATVSSGNKVGTFTHNVTDKGYVYVDWEMYEAKDKITIYVDGKVKYTTGHPVSNGEGGPIGFYYKPSDGKIKVVINEGGISYSTGWKYTLYCPGKAPDSVSSKARFV